MENFFYSSNALLNNLPDMSLPEAISEDYHPLRLLTDTLGSDPSDHKWVVVIAGFAMVYMAWGIGANDCANNFATAWGSGALSFNACIAIAAVLEATGAIFLGGDVQKTFRKGIADQDLYGGNDGRILVYVGMTAVLISAGTWLLIASKFGLPVSTTHSAVGGVISFAIITKGYDSVKWEKVGLIVASWFISPLSSMLFSFGLYSMLKKHVLQQQDSLQRTAKVAPFLIFVTGFVISLFVCYKGAKGIDLDETPIGIALGISFGVGILLALGCYPIVQHVYKKLEEENKGISAVSNASSGSGETKDVGTVVVVVEGEEGGNGLAMGDAENKTNENNTDTHKKNVDDSVSKDKSEVTVTDIEKSTDADENADPVIKHSPAETMWCGFAWVTASFQALAHGGNDVANSVGPFAAVLAAEQGEISKKSECPIWVYIVAGLAISIGLATYGKSVMITIGKNVASTQLKPSKAFASEFSATAVILAATRLGIPISTTHASVGAVMGVGAADGGWKDGLKWNVLFGVFASWVGTIPIVAIFASGLYGFMLPMCVDTPIV